MRALKARWLLRSSVSATAVLTLAACGTGAAHDHDTSHSAKASTAASHSPAPSASAMTKAVAAANERTLAYWLATPPTDISGVAHAVSGQLMTSYVRFQSLIYAADAESGRPDGPQSVSLIPGGYLLHGTDNNGSPFSYSLTGFRTDAVGRVVEMNVNGRPIPAKNLAVGRAATGSQVAISDVYSYLPADIGSVVVAFRVRNVRGQALANGSPAFLPVFDPVGGAQFSYEYRDSIFPDSLQPGESAVGYAVFGTRKVTGIFSLRSNDQLMSVLVSTTLHKVRP